MSDNAATTSAVDAYATGGMLFAVTYWTSLSFTATNSTISGNVASAALGSASGGAITAERINPGSDPRLDISLYSVTLTANQATGTAGWGGALLLNGFNNASAGGVGVANSIVSGNLAATDPNFGCTTVGGEITSLGYNLFGALDSCPISGAVANNLVGITPGLSGLADNGGPTFTHALLASSPAIDAGNPAGCTSALDGTVLTVDQRGEARAVGGRCDIGAYEFMP